MSIFIVFLLIMWRYRFQCSKARASDYPKAHAIAHKIQIADNFSSSINTLKKRCWYIPFQKNEGDETRSLTYRENSS